MAKGFLVSIVEAQNPVRGTVTSIVGERSLNSCTRAWV